MKKIFLMRHSIPEKGDMPNEQIPLSEEGKALAVSKRNIVNTSSIFAYNCQMWTDAFLHLIGEQWKRLNSSQITRSL